MTTAQRPELRRALRLGGLPCLWLAFAVMMVRNYLGDPYDPSLEGTAAYGHNQEGALLQGLGLSLSELIIVSGILRPWSYDRSWGRGIATFALLLPWTALALLSMMHSGGVFALHALWLMIVLVGVLVMTIVSAITSKTHA